MSKRGMVELLIVLIVLIIAVIGVLYVLSPGRSPSGKDAAPDYNAPSGAFTVPAVQEVSAGNSITGHFVIPAAKAYGGDVRGVYEAHARAFSGRAYELPEQSCYTCSCLKDGITAVDRSAAAQVCTNNCGGQITDVVVGPCR